ncbi:MAG: GrpB family protein [Candidatus Nanoarchaeia archaeon]|nr:GrpB family protein [Candidatus Nanoarchaeia archaeon]MDD5239113.1 GrpB family protein [Candidatus Nanoarchaeia archaeon]
MQKYVFRKYNPEYRAFFTSEKKKIAKALGSTATIEHVGSTAIPNLGGKGILDVAVGVSKSKIVESKNKLEKEGYEFREKASYPERLFFRIDYPYKNRKRRIHIHLTKFNGQDWKEMIGFRDYLLKHPEAVEQYVKIKKEGVKKALGDGEKYRKHKEEFIQNILRKALE